MTPFAALWIPIVASAVLVFVASSVIHMVLKYHNTEFRGLANEDDVRSAIRAGGPAPGQYVLPHCPDMKAMRAPEMLAKFQEGPVAFLTLRPPGLPRIGASLALWFVYSLAVAALGAYVACHVLAPGASFARACQVTGTLAFAAYAGGSIQGGIWMGKPWSSVAKDVIDALVYAVLTGLAFGWLWPR